MELSAGMTAVKINYDSYHDLIDRVEFRKLDEFYDFISFMTDLLRITGLCRMFINQNFAMMNQKRLD